MPVFAENSETGTVEEALKQNSANEEEDANEVADENNANNEVNEEQQQLSFAEPPSLLSLFGKLVFALAIIIALIYLFVRFIGKRTRSFSTNHSLQNIGGVPLGTNRSIQIVKVGERLLIVGVGDTIQLLKEIDDKKEIELILKDTEGNFDRLETPLTKTFDKFGQLLKKNKKEVHQETNTKIETNRNLEFRELLNKQLKDVSQSQRKIHEAMKEHRDE